mmetsp:Transcript_64307/g.102398  ORF Transcript_64307/g.102398 Transcript_64307/m.102398 type:complete len:247 (-) Transcript_64307:88-828(-)
MLQQAMKIERRHIVWMRRHFDLNVLFRFIILAHQIQQKSIRPIGTVLKAVKLQCLQITYLRAFVIIEMGGQRDRVLIVQVAIIRRDLDGGLEIFLCLIQIFTVSAQKQCVIFIADCELLSRHCVIWIEFHCTQQLLYRRCILLLFPEHHAVVVPIPLSFRLYLYRDAQLFFRLVQMLPIIIDQSQREMQICIIWFFIKQQRQYVAGNEIFFVAVQILNARAHIVGIDVALRVIEFQTARFHRFAEK